MQDERIWPADETEIARRVVKQHQGYGCRHCTPVGCPMEDWAMGVVFDVVVKSWPAGPRTLADVERVADEIRDDG
jgi:hypothetical protein